MTSTSNTLSSTLSPAFSSPQPSTQSDSQPSSPQAAPSYTSPVSQSFSPRPGSSERLVYRAGADGSSSERLESGAGDDDDAGNDGGYSYSPVLHSYGERADRDDDDQELGHSGQHDGARGAHSERVDEAETDEQDRMREAGSQGLFGGDSMREEEEDDAARSPAGPEDGRDEARLQPIPEDNSSAQHDVATAAGPQSPPPRKRKRDEDDSASPSPRAALPPPAAPTRSTSGGANSRLLPPSPAASPSLRAPTRAAEFAVPEPPSLSSGKRRPLSSLGGGGAVYSKRAEEYTQSFSLPPSYSSSLQPPPPPSMANVSPMSHDYAAAANFSPAPSRSGSTLPPPLAHPATYALTSPFPPPSSSYSSSRPAGAAASPPHPHAHTSPHTHGPFVHSPSLPPMSPHASPRISWPPSSPRCDSITSVTHRVEQWQRAGRVQRMMANVHLHSSAASVSSALSTAPTRLPDSSNREALLRIDRYLRRRYVFAVMDSDMIVRGTVYNKTSAGLIITVWQVDAAAGRKGEAEAGRAEGVVPPTLSSAWGEGREAEMHDLEDLEIRGECHLTEMQAALQTDARGAATTPAAPAGEQLDSRAVLDSYNVGDAVRALVISVDVHSEKVYLSMNNARLKHSAASTAGSPQTRLGPYKEPALSPRGGAAQPPSNHAATEPLYSAPTVSAVSSLSSSLYGLQASPSPSSLPVPYGFPSFNRAPSLSSSPGGSATSTALSLLSPFAVPKRRARPANFLRWLRTQPLFLNPAGLRILLDAYAINQYGSLTPPCTIPPSSLYVPLRAQQNLQWARDTTLKGIGMAKRGLYANAHKLYAHALEIEPQHTQAIVARGACYMLEARWADAQRDFEHALQLDPAHAHAKHYLKACNDRLRKQADSSTDDTAATAQARPVDAGKEVQGRTGAAEESKEEQGGGDAVAMTDVVVLSDDSDSSEEKDGRQERRRGDKKERKRDRRGKRRRKERHRDSEQSEHRQHVHLD